MYIYIYNYIYTFAVLNASLPFRSSEKSHFSAGDSDSFQTDCQALVGIARVSRFKKDVRSFS